MALEKNGLVKLVEEMGELSQVAAKKMACMDTDEHWDGAGSLKERLEDEAADVVASISIVVENFGLDNKKMAHLTARKLALFRQWMNEP